MQYQVPQFIEVEDTIVGPLTIKQFIYLATSGFICVILYFILQGAVFFIVAALVGGSGLTLAFAKYNGRPVTTVLVAAFRYFLNPRIYIWKRKEEVAALRAAEAEKHESAVQQLWLRITAGKDIVPQRPKERSAFGVPQKYQVIEHVSGARENVKRIDYR